MKRMRCDLQKVFTLMKNGRDTMRTETELCLYRLNYQITLINVSNLLIDPISANLC